jgi:hypothetical protein
MASTAQNMSHYGAVPGEFRIARVNRGELVTGFRVQEYRFQRRFQEHRWMNCGRLVYTVEAARDLKEFTIRQRSMQMLPQAEYTEIQ